MRRVQRSEDGAQPRQLGERRASRPSFLKPGRSSSAKGLPLQRFVLDCGEALVADRQRALRLLGHGALRRLRASQQLRPFALVLFPLDKTGLGVLIPAAVNNGPDQTSEIVRRQRRNNAKGAPHRRWPATRSAAPETPGPLLTIAA